MHVTVRGGTVVPALADTWLDGSVPAGAETTTAAAAQRFDNWSRWPTWRRRACFGSPSRRHRQAVVNARLVSTSGAARSRGRCAENRRRLQCRHPLADVPAGTYAVEINADLPVVTAVFSAARAASEPG